MSVCQCVCHWVLSYVMSGGRSFRQEYWQRGHDTGGCVNAQAFSLLYEIDSCNQTCLHYVEIRHFNQFSRFCCLTKKITLKWNWLYTHQHMSSTLWGALFQDHPPVRPYALHVIRKTLREHADKKVDLKPCHISISKRNAKRFYQAPLPPGSRSSDLGLSNLLSTLLWWSLIG